MPEGMDLSDNRFSSRLLDEDAFGIDRTHPNYKPSKVSFLFEQGLNILQNCIKNGLFVGSKIWFYLFLLKNFAKKIFFGRSSIGCAISSVD